MYSRETIDGASCLHESLSRASFKQWFLIKLARSSISLELHPFTLVLGPGHRWLCSMAKTTRGVTVKTGDSGGGGGGAGVKLVASVLYGYTNIAKLMEEEPLQQP